MTDELNEIASAYVDGETTPDQTAWVENDDRAQKVVEDIQRLSARINSVEPQVEATRERHIAAALSTFDVSTSETVSIKRSDLETTRKIDPLPDNVVYLSPDEATNKSGDDSRHLADPKGKDLVGNVVPIASRSQYRWLTPLAGAAAFILVLGAGFTLLASQRGFTGSTEDSSSGAVAEAASQDDALEEAEPSNAESNLTDSASGEEAVSDEQADSAAEESVGDERANSAAEESVGDEQAGEFAADSESNEIEEDIAGGQLPDRVPLTFDVLPNRSELEAIGSETELLTDYEPSSCAANVSAPEGETLIGVVPIVVDNSFVELVVFTSESSSLGISVSALDEQCQSLL